MLRKLVVVLLTGVMCLVGITSVAGAEFQDWYWNSPQEYEQATGNKIEKFNEAPMLRTRVAAGELPALKERLPVNPLVIKPYEEIGRYGGKMFLPMLSPSGWFPASQATEEYIFSLDIRWPSEMIFNIATDWEMSEDGKVLTLFFRKGLKWSDGVPFTADDVMFWWKDFMLNEDLTPVIPVHWKPKGELMTVEKVDDYTVRFHFGVAYYAAPYYFGELGRYGMQKNCYLPKHALTKWHIKYNPKANELAKEEGYDHWWQLFNSKAEFFPDSPQHTDIPLLGPWIVQERFTDGVSWKRNPYYHVVDTEGNQLPYIDELRGIYFGDAATLVMRTLSGDYDYVPYSLTPADYPLLQENADRGGYRTWLAPGPFPCAAPAIINQNYDVDPVMGDLLRNKKFRQALSVALDREDMTQAVVLGQAVPLQVTCVPTNSFYQERWAKAYAEYDPEKANAWLDEIGLTKRDDEGFRLKPDGKRMTLLVEFPIQKPWIVDAGEIMKEYWEAVGIRTLLKSEDYTLIFQKMDTGNYMVSSWSTHDTNETYMRFGGGKNVVNAYWSMPKWVTWWATEGKSGVEPPKEVKRIFSLWDDMPFMNQEEFIKAAIETCEFQAENIIVIGTFGYMQSPFVANQDLGNVDDENVQGTLSGLTGGMRCHRLEQFFWKK